MDQPTDDHGEEDGPDTNEKNRLSGRAKRYSSVSSGLGGLAMRMASDRLLGREKDHARDAAELRAALGTLKGPLMKVAQMLATIPDAVPEEYARELAQLQSDAPPMSWPFIKRRMRSELGAGWQSRFSEFEHEAAAAASLGQVHRAVHHDGRAIACKLQYPDMSSAVEADLNQLAVIFSIQRRMDTAINTREMQKEIGDRLREELDYGREARHMNLYRDMLNPIGEIEVPTVVDELSTDRLLTMTWLNGERLMAFVDHPLEQRNQIARAMFKAWWYPFSHFGVIHGDPHLGNYTVRPDMGINLLDFGCIRIFPPSFVLGVVGLYHALERDDRDQAVAAYEIWGFKNLSNELIDTLNIWARFIYGPMLDDRVRSIADGISPGLYGRKQAGMVHKKLKELGPVTPPKEFVFMDRAAIGLGGVFLHLAAELNWHDMFKETLEGVTLDTVTERQSAALKKHGLDLPN